MNTVDAANAANVLDRLCRPAELGFPVPDRISLRLVPMDAVAAHADVLHALLDEQELVRAAAIRHQGRSLAYCGGRAVARLMLSSVVDSAVAPSAWRIVPDRAGKPRVATGAGISIAHAGEMLGVAVTATGEVGLDLEPLGGTGSIVPLEHLHPSELARLHSLPEHRRSDAHIRLWTVKEAVAKCRGEGVAADFSIPDASPVLMKQLSFRSDGCDIFASSAVIGSQHYSFAIAWFTQSKGSSGD